MPLSRHRFPSILPLAAALAAGVWAVPTRASVSPRFLGPSSCAFGFNIPTNDAVAASAPVEVGRRFSVPNVAANDEPGEESVLPGDIESGVWFVVTPASNRPLLVTTRDSTFFSVAAVYTNIPGLPIVPENLIRVAADEEYFSPRSATTFTPLPGTNYYIRVGGVNSDLGQVQLTVRELTSPQLSPFDETLAFVGLPFRTEATLDVPATGVGADGAGPLALSKQGDRVTLTGVFATAGERAITVRASNEAGTGMRAVTVRTEIPPVPVFRGRTVDLYEDTPADRPIIATPGITTVTAAGLPPGMGVQVLEGQQGFEFTGTAALPGTVPVTVTVGNAGGTFTTNLTLNIQPLTPPTITTTSVTGFVAHASGVALRSDAPVTAYTALTPPPPGLTLEANGFLTGTPDTAGSFQFMAQAQNAAGNGPVGAIQVTILAPQPPRYEGDTTVELTAGKAKAFSFRWSDPSSCQAVLTDPVPGLQFHPHGFSGTPLNAGMHSLRLFAANHGGFTEQRITLRIAPAATATNDNGGSGSGTAEKWELRITKPKGKRPVLFRPGTKGLGLVLGRLKTDLARGTDVDVLAGVSRTNAPVVDWVAASKVTKVSRGKSVRFRFSDTASDVPLRDGETIHLVVRASDNFARGGITNAVELDVRIP